MKKIFLSLFIIVNCSFANIGKITSFKGEVVVNRGNKDFPASIGFILEKQDAIVTKDKSKALILFNDGTSITVGKDSVLKVNEYIQDTATPKNNQANFGFGKGVFRTITGQIGKANPDGFKMETKTSSLGIRGSDGSTFVRENGDISHTTNSGGFYMMNKRTGEIVEIPKGMTAKLEVQSGKMALNPTTKADAEEVDEVEKNDDIEQEKTAVETKDENKDEAKEETKDENKDALKEEKKENLQENEKQEETPVQSPIETTPLQEEMESNGIAPNIDENQIPLDEIQNNLDVAQETVNDSQDDLNQEILEETIEELIKEETPTTISDIFSLTPQGDLTTLSVDLATVTKQIIGNDTYNGTNLLEYGYIFNSLEQKIATYLTGITTPSAVIDQYITNNQTASYIGSIASFANGVATDGTINLNMNFGTKNFTGNINVGENWKANINSGTISSYGFNTTNISTASDSAIQNITGSLAGKYYGSTASSVGGTLKLNSGSNSINGVFGAKK